MMINDTFSTPKLILAIHDAIMCGFILYHVQWHIMALLAAMSIDTCITCLTKCSNIFFSWKYKHICTLDHLNMVSIGSFWQYFSFVILNNINGSSINVNIFMCTNHTISETPHPKNKKEYRSIFFECQKSP